LTKLERTTSKIGRSETNLFKINSLGGSEFQEKMQTRALEHTLEKTFRAWPTKAVGVLDGFWQ